MTRRSFLTALSLASGTMFSGWQPDGLGYRARIGLLTPNDDAVPESEFWTMAPNPPHPDDATAHASDRSCLHDCMSSEHFGQLAWQFKIWLIWFEGSGCDCLLMQAASLFDGFSFDLFPPFENGLTAPEVDVSRRQVVQALVVSTVVVVLDELLDAVFELSWQVVVFQQEQPGRMNDKSVGNLRLLSQRRSTSDDGNAAIGAAPRQRDPGRAKPDRCRDHERKHGSEEQTHVWSDRVAVRATGVAKAAPRPQSPRD